MNQFAVLGKHREARRSSISLTPLIDVVFILLLFFMLTSTFNRYHSLELSSTTVGESAERVKGQPPVLVTVLGGAWISLQHVEYTLPSAEFDQQVEELRSDAPIVLVTAGPLATIQELITGIEELQARGLRRLEVLPSGAGVVPREL